MAEVYWHKRILLMVEEFCKCAATELNLLGKEYNRAPIASYHANLGSLYERIGKLDQALRYYWRAADVVGDSDKAIAASITYHLGCLYSKLGEKRQAKKFFRKTLHRIPDHRKARKYISDLSRSSKTRKPVAIAGN